MILLPTWPHLFYELMDYQTEGGVWWLPLNTEGELLESEVGVFHCRMRSWFYKKHRYVGVPEAEPFSPKPFLLAVDETRDYRRDLFIFFAFFP